MCSVRHSDTRTVLYTCCILRVYSEGRRGTGSCGQCTFAVHAGVDAFAEAAGAALVAVHFVHRAAAGRSRLARVLPAPADRALEEARAPAHTSHSLNTGLLRTLN